MDLDEFHQLMKARRNVYDLLRCLFLQEPSDRFFGALREEGLLEKLCGYHPDLDEGVSLLSQSISDPCLPVLLPALVDEFTRLFIGPLPIPLFESVYRSASGLVMQEETVAVRRKYFEAGLAVNPRGTFPEDHIATELEFVFYLCGKATEAQQPDQQRAHLQMQADFFREHLAVWIPALCGRLYAEAESPYFKGIAKLTKGFIEWDYREIVAQFAEL